MIDGMSDADVLASAKMIGTEGVKMSTPVISTVQTMAVTSKHCSK